MYKKIILLLLSGLSVTIVAVNNPHLLEMERQIDELTHKVQRLNAQEQNYKLREMRLQRQGANPQQVRNIQEKRDNLKVEILDLWDQIGELEERVGRA